MNVAPSDVADVGSSAKLARGTPSGDMAETENVTGLSGIPATFAGAVTTGRAPWTRRSICRVVVAPELSVAENARW